MDAESCLDKSSLSKILTYDVPPDSHISFALFTDVENMSEVRKCVMNGEFEAALLKTSMVSFIGLKNNFLFFFFFKLLDFSN